jgi:hypothetical protein
MGREIRKCLRLQPPGETCLEVPARPGISIEASRHLSLPFSRPLEVPDQNLSTVMFNDPPNRLGSPGVFVYKCQRDRSYCFAAEIDYDCFLHHLFQTNKPTGYHRERDCRDRFCQAMTRS